MNREKKIAIVGGGIGGLTTALCLEHFGFKNYSIYEQASEFKEIGAAVSLWPNALRVYQKLGIYADLEPQWGEIHSAFIKTDTGKVLGTSTPKYELPLVCIHRADLHSTLLKRLDSQKLYARHKLQSLMPIGENVQLEFEQGRQVEADVVIGADGIRSVVRQVLINDGLPTFRGYNIWRGIAHLEGVPAGYSSETWGKGQRVGIVPIKDNKFGWWATANEAEGQDDRPHGALNKLKGLFGSWHEPIPQLFENSPEIMKNKIGDREPVKSWFQGNTVLMGDAAHPTTPNLGQGACMAIEGAFLLAKCMGHFESSHEAFARYQDLHYHRSSSVVKQSLQNGKMGQLENGAAIKARNTMIKALPEKLLLKMLDKYFAFDVRRVKV